jgi:hypothetical protein
VVGLTLDAAVVGEAVVGNEVGDLVGVGRALGATLGTRLGAIVIAVGGVVGGESEHSKLPRLTVNRAHDRLKSRPKTPSKVASPAL